MKCVLVFASCLLAVSATPGGLYAGYAAPIAAATSSQYHAQDELGQYSYGYSGGPSAKQETRTADGITRGGYSYVDANGLVQSTSYVSDPVNGFRVAATNLPVAPAAPVVAPVVAPVAVAPVAVAPVVTEARLVDPVAIAAGAPLPTGDTVEVAAAKAVHFQAHADATVRNHGVISYAAHPVPIAYAAHAAPLAYAHASPLAYNYAHAAPVAYAHGHLALASEARLVDPVAIAAGAPLPTGDTVEVAAAKAAHFHAHAVARSGLRYKRGLAYAAAPLAYAAYAPRSFGYSSVTAHTAPFAYAHAAPLAYAHAAPIALASEARLIDPVAIAAGAPLPTGDTVEVAAAKAAHLHAHAAATVRNHGVFSYAAHAAPLAYAAHAAPLAYAHAAPLAYAHGHVALASEARQIDPVAIAAGAPLPTGDTVEVAAAKAAHLHAHASETARHLGAIIY